MEAHVTFVCQCVVIDHALCRDVGGTLPLYASGNWTLSNAMNQTCEPACQFCMCHMVLATKHRFCAARRCMSWEPNNQRLHTRSLVGWSLYGQIQCRETEKTTKQARHAVHSKTMTDGHACTPQPTGSFVDRPDSRQTSTCVPWEICISLSALVDLYFHL